MSEIKHTPGPYLREGTRVYALDETGTVKRMNARVEGGTAVFDRRGPVGRSQRTTYEEVEATAQLFAASPELAQALEKTQAALDVWLVTYASDFCRDSDVDNAKAAIREAGGTIAYVTDVLETARAALTKAGL